MKIQRRAGRPSSLTGRSSSSNGNDNGMGNDANHEANGSNGAAEAYDESADVVEPVETHAEVPRSAEVTRANKASGAKKTNGSEKAEVPTLSNASNGSNGSRNTSVTAPTLPKRRRPVVSSPTEVIARPVEKPEIPSRRTGATGAPVVAPAVAVAPAPRKPLAPWRLLITYENVFWLAILGLTIASRFWDLGSRAIHHDESLHSHFSDVLYTGGGYIHDPMMHGPIQFHLIAFMFWLFGATDATARFASVFCGIWVVMSPFFLRKQMGRVPAMVCSFLLLISPSILYFSRMAREDAIFSGMETLMLVGLWRFVSMRKPADFVLFMAGFSLMFTIKETSFLTLGIVGIFLIGIFAYQAGYAVLAALGGYLLAAGGLFIYINSGMKAGTIVGLPNIQNPGPDTNTIMTFAMKFLTHPIFYGEVTIFVLFLVAVSVLMSMQRNSYSGSFVPVMPSQMRLRPAMAGAGAGTDTGNGIPRRAARPSSSGATSIPTNGHEESKIRDYIAAADSELPEVQSDYPSYDEAMDVQEVWDPRAMKPKPDTILARYQPGSLPYLLGALFARPKIILLGFLVATTIFVTFYTVFFTDIPHGLVSGLFGSLGYWMGQQDVARGGQPWFYYFLLIPLYEPVAVFFSIAATIFFSWRGIRWLVIRKRGYDDAADDTALPLSMFNTERSVPFTNMKSFLPLFLIWWLLGTVFIYSWAGEKMPWLMMHMVRPAIFLASLFVGALVLSLLKRRKERLAAAGAYDSQRVLANAPVASSTNGVPSRRRTSSAARVAQPVILSAQEPPWVTWSKPGSRFPLTAFLTLFVLLVVSWGLLMNALTWRAKFDASHYGDFNSWGWTWIYPVIILAMVIGYAVWVGPGRSLRYLGLGILTVGLMYQFRSAINLAYNQPDVSTELASYVQTTPDVTRVMNEIKTFADYTTSGTDIKGGNSIKIMYDSFTSWPMEWYLRDYNKIFIGDGAVQPAADVPILLLEFNKHKDPLDSTRPAPLPNYVGQRYAMRWWFPQEWYMDDFLPNQYVTDAKGARVLDKNNQPIKASAVAQVGDALHTIGVTVAQPSFESTLWKYLIFRDPPKPLGSEDMVLYLRRDIAQLYHRLQYDPPTSTDIP